MLIYNKNKHVTARAVSDGEVEVECALADTLHSGSVAMRISFPQFEILSIRGGFSRAIHPECRLVEGRLQELAGMRIGPGFTALVDGVIGGGTGCTKLANMVLECCHAAMPAFRIIRASSFVKNNGEMPEDTRRWLERFPRFRNSCVTYSDDSPVMKVLDLGRP